MAQPLRIIANLVDQVGGQFMTLSPVLGNPYPLLASLGTCIHNAIYSCGYTHIYKNKNLKRAGAREMVQQLKHLLHKQEASSLDPQNPYKGLVAIQSW